MKTVDGQELDRLGRILAPGQAVFIRTVGYHYTGRVVEVGEQFVVLDEAAWIAESGRWAAALAKGALDEGEPYPGPVAVLIASILDVSPWNHPLPREQR